MPTLRSWPLLLAVLGAIGCGGSVEADEEVRPVGDRTPARPLPALPIGPRPPAFLGLPSKLALTGDGWETVAAFPGISFDNPVSFEEAPGLGHIFVAEREGRLFAFEKHPEVAAKKLVLDLSAVNQGENDSGLLGMAFHPEFANTSSPNHGYIYLHYAYTDDPVVGSAPSFSKRTHSRLARFTVDLQTLKIDKASELVLIDQYDRHIWHQGGALFFHPEDGFLYLAVGDEGARSCSLGNCQRIDRNLFSGVLRIDVDQRGGAVSHPIVRQPRDGTTAHYYIPSDNPFVGEPGSLEEFYAIGLRSPHRMTYDAYDDIAWIGDVGQNGREELNILRRGANYQWHAFEGFRRTDAPMPESPLGIWTDPVLDLQRTESRAIIGGYVYRGRRFPELQGKYIFGDFELGNIWALAYEFDGEAVSDLDRELLLQTRFRGRTDGITSFGIDAEGEIYILTLGKDSKIHHLEKTAPSANVPRLLSQAGVFSDLANLSVTSGLIAYDVQTPLWSDGSEKFRWAAIPEGATIGFAPKEPWSFPPGTVFVKHFEIALDERAPSVRRRLETRLLVAGGTSEYYGITYIWNEEGTDAELLSTSRLERLQIIGPDGAVRHQPYFYPGPNDCKVCHNPESGYVLGVRTLQLNGPLTFEHVGRQNQLSVWSRMGLFDRALSNEWIRSFPSLAPLSDTTRSVQDRVRSYWDANCSMCHGVVAGLHAEWDARFLTPLSEQGVLLATPIGDSSEGTFLVVPGDTERSLLFRRLATSDPNVAMPPLGRHLPDEGYLDLLESWIVSLSEGEDE